MGIRHAFVSNKADDPDSTLINPSDWNEEHTFSETSAPLEIFRRKKNTSTVEYEFTL